MASASNVPAASPQRPSKPSIHGAAGTNSAGASASPSAPRHKMRPKLPGRGQERAATDGGKGAAPSPIPRDRDQRDKGTGEQEQKQVGDQRPQVGHAGKNGAHPTDQRAVPGDQADTDHIRRPENRQQAEDQEESLLA